MAEPFSVLESTSSCSLMSSSSISSIQSSKFDLSSDTSESEKSPVKTLKNHSSSSTTNGHPCNHSFVPAKCACNDPSFSFQICSKCSLLRCGSSCYEPKVKPVTPPPKEIPSVSHPQPAFPSSSDSKTLISSSENQPEQITLSTAVDTNPKLINGTTTSISELEKVKERKEKKNFPKKPFRSSIFRRNGNTLSFQEQIELEKKLASLEKTKTSQPNGEPENVEELEQASSSSPNVYQDSDNLSAIQRHFGSKKNLTSEHLNKNLSKECSKTSTIAVDVQTPNDHFTTYLQHFVQLEAGNKKPIDTLQSVPSSGIPLKMNVVHVLKPSCIFLQSLEMENWTKKISGDLEKRNLTNAHPISEEQYVAVNYNNCFYRGQIERLDPIYVRLVDKGILVEKHSQHIYKLPSEFLQIRRQIVGLLLPDIQIPRGANSESKCYEFLQQQLLGQEVSVIVSHLVTLECFRGQHYGFIEYNGKSLSSLLLEKKLAINANITEKVDSGVVVSTINPKYKKLELSKLEKGECIKAYICHVNSPSEFYVRRDKFEVHLNNIQRHLTQLKTTGNLGLYLNDVVNCGNSVCVASHPSDSKILCRAVCEGINYKTEKPTATVFLVDYGETATVALSDLLEYPASICNQHCLPLCYRCEIDASPIGESWPAAVIVGLQNIQQKNGIQLTCLRSTNNANVVTFKLEGQDLPWEDALINSGQASVKNETKALKCSDTIFLPTTRGFSKFVDTNVRTEVTQSESKYSVGLLPSSTPLQPGDRLKTKRNKSEGYHSYVVMSERCYQTYLQLQKQAANLIEKRAKSKESNPDQFRVGDVVLYPYCGHWHRCCILSFDMENGIRNVKLDVFDVRDVTSGAASLIKEADESFMKVEKLGYKVWLEGIDESDAVFSLDFDEVLGGGGITLLEGLKEVKDSLVVRLRTLAEDGSRKDLLSHCIKNLLSWRWESLFNTGVFQHDVLVERTKHCLNSSFQVSNFIHSNRFHLKKAVLHRVQIRHAEKSDCGQIYLKVLPKESFYKTDYALLINQLNKYYETVEYKDVSQKSTTFPVLVAIQKFSGTSRLGLGSSCLWHRSLYNEENNLYECVDCFETTPVPKSALSGLKEFMITHSLEIKELCPEMLKVPPLGQYLVYWPTSSAPAVNDIILEELRVGKIVQAFVKPESTTDYGHVWQSTSIVEVSNRNIVANSHYVEYTFFTLPNNWLQRLRMQRMNRPR